MIDKKVSILVVGSINMDLVLKTSRIPYAGESFFGDSYCHIPGGKGANHAVAAARLGAKVTFAGKIGNDANGMALKASLEKQGISTELLKVDENSPSGLAVIMLEESGQNRILVYSGANMELEPEEIVRAFEKSYDAVMLTLEIPQKVVIETCRKAKEKNIPVILDAGPAQSFPLEKISGIELLTPNETEATALTGLECNTKKDAEKAASALEEKSQARWIVIKMGEQGALLYHKGESELFPAHKVEVVDTTAAGDAFTAGLMIAYTQHGDIQKAIRYANVVGALTVTKLGAQPSLPTAEEVEKFMLSLKS